MAHIGGVTGGIAGSIAAAEKARQDREEEEHMTNYSPEDLRDDWEFKIVRSTFEAFRKPETLQRVIAEEARAGWTLVEKFDNGRLRFKRPASARANDHILPPEVDPYRTTFGAGSGVMALIVFGVTMLLGLGIILAILLAA
jgi:hypothetical protein